MNSPHAGITIFTGSPECADDLTGVAATNASPVASSRATPECLEVHQQQPRALERSLSEGNRGNYGGDESSPLLVRGIWTRDDALHFHPSPPVAPAFVVTTEEASSTHYHRPSVESLVQSSMSSASQFPIRGTADNYPVATFVRDYLIRSNIMDQDHITQEISMSGDDATLDGINRTYLSEPNVLRNDHSSMTVRANAENERTPSALTVRSLDGIRMNVSTSVATATSTIDEFILVDGDLVAIPPPPPNAAEQQGYEKKLRDQIRSFQPSWLRRQVRKFSRFVFKRTIHRRDENVDHTPQDRLEQQTQHPQPLLPQQEQENEHQQQQQQQHQQQCSTTLCGLNDSGCGERRFSETSVVSSKNSPISTTSSNNQFAGGLRRSMRKGGHSTRSMDSCTKFRGISPNESCTQPSQRHRRRAKRRSRVGWRRGEEIRPTVNSSDEAIGEDSAMMAAASRSMSSLSIQTIAHSSGSIAQMPSIYPLSDDEHRAQSVTASFVGTEDQLLMAGVLPAGIAAEAYIEYEDDAKSKLYANDVVPSMLPSFTSPYIDYKVDKSDGPDVEAMLQRATMETECEIDHSNTSDIIHLSKLRKSKSEPDSSLVVPLSQATASDAIVHNDMLKVVMVGNLLEKSWLARAIRENYKRPPKRTTLALDVRTWFPAIAATTSSSSVHTDEKSIIDQLPIRYQIWDVQGATGAIDGIPNFGAHPATQSLFFTSQSLFVLVWDLAGKNCKTFHRKASSFGKNNDLASFAAAADICSDSENEDDEDDYGNEFAREEANRQADRALHAEIRHQVLTLVDWIAKRGPKSAILPVAIISDGMEQYEIKRRCVVMQSLLERHVQSWSSSPNAPKLLCGTEDVLRVSYAGCGLQQLRETLVAIATDASMSVFDHVGSPVPCGAAVIFNTCRKLKSDHALLLIDHLMLEIGSILTREQVIESLRFLANVGEIVYFGTSNDDILSRFIVLNRKWLVSAISCILRNDLKRELAETRRFMNMQCLYSNQRFEENEVAHALAGGTTSSCPLLSGVDAQMLWQSMSFMREAVDRSAALGELPTSAPSLYFFLEHLLVVSGILVPVACLKDSRDGSQVFFVPSLLGQVDPREIWTYRTSESWMTTLCHSWLFRDGAPINIMEHVTVSVLRDVYELSHSFQSIEKKNLANIRTIPIGAHSFYEDPMDQPIGRVRIHQIMCWQTSVLIKLGTVYAEPVMNELRESFVEIFITMVDQSSDTCVASDAMRLGMHRVIASAKGQVGHHGKKIWEGGFKCVLLSIEKALKSYSNVDSQVICPECLAHSHPHSASTWSFDSVKAAAEAGSTVVRCMRGHRIGTNLIGGISKESLKAPPDETGPMNRHEKHVASILPSVVLVGLWDPYAQQITRVGSGFLVDRKLGLVVTAAHVLFSWVDDTRFGTAYYGVRHARAAIGVLENESREAVFRYFGEIVAEDVHHVDACVVRIIVRMENDVKGDGQGCAYQPENILDSPELIQNENLPSLKIAKRFDLEEPVRILGFNQGGEGVFEQGEHVNRHVDVAKGYISGEFKMAKANASDESSDEEDDSDADRLVLTTFVPREEIVIMCPTIPGHSGGPCVNEEGKVVGILSRADPASRLRCYLVPFSELRELVKSARKRCQTIS